MKPNVLLLSQRMKREKPPNKFDEELKKCETTKTKQAGIEGAKTKIAETH